MASPDRTASKDHKRTAPGSLLRYLLRHGASHLFSTTQDASRSYKNANALVCTSESPLFPTLMRTTLV
jgi:hypothetical protein